MKECFIERNFSKGSLAIIEKANGFLDEYQAQGLILTLRQLFYIFVSRDELANKQTEYKRLGSIISDARLAGLLDWQMMEDRTRNLKSAPSWDDPADILDTVAAQYKEDLWRNQKARVEVWIEKDALVGVIERACRDLRVNYFACRGYASQSAQYEAGKRLASYRNAGQLPVILHLGDHDPSGIDMTRDNKERLSMFAGETIKVCRIALNMDQIDEYEPPPNPAKETDSRAADYIEKFGSKSWELDALEPKVIDQLIRDYVNSYIDSDLWKKAKEQEVQNLATLKNISNRWEEVESYISTLPQED